MKLPANSAGNVSLVKVHYEMMFSSTSVMGLNQAHIFPSFGDFYRYNP